MWIDTETIVANVTQLCSLYRSEQSVQWRVSLGCHDARYDRKWIWRQASRADVDACRLVCSATRRPATGQEHQSRVGQPRSVAQVPHARHRDDYHKVRKVCPLCSLYIASLYNALRPTNRNVGHIPSFKLTNISILIYCQLTRLLWSLM